MARRPHLTLCLLAAASALTTPPASRLGTPERAALGGVGVSWIALGARTFDAANAREAVGALENAEKLDPKNKQVVDALRMAAYKARQQAEAGGA